MTSSHPYLKVSQEQRPDECHLEAGGLGGEVAGLLEDLEEQRGHEGPPQVVLAPPPPTVGDQVEHLGADSNTI